jgi:hypothetical protein
MKLENWVRVRLNESQMLIYTAEAEARGIPISTYLRDRMASADIMREELAGIRAALLELGDTLDELRDQCANAGDKAGAQVQAETAIPNAVQIETLMLLRAIASPEKLRMIRAELDRQGIESWQGPVR